VIGIGGAGCEAVVRVRENHPVEVSYLMLDRDEQSLRGLGGCTAITLGRDMRPRPFCYPPPGWVEAAVWDEEPLLGNILADVRRVLVVAGLGGATGSEAAPAVMRLAKNVGAVPYGVFTRPFAFEGRRSHERADKALAAVRQNPDPHLLFPCDREIVDLPRNTPIKECLAFVNRRLVYGTTVWIDLMRQYAPDLEAEGYL